MGIHGKTRNNELKGSMVHTQVSNSRVFFWFGPENEKATELGLSPQFFVRLVPNSAKTGCFFSFFSSKMIKNTLGALPKHWKTSGS